MREELENRIIETLKRVYNHNNISLDFENLDNYPEILEKIQNEEILKSFQDIFVLWESYRFIRTDKMLMLKAREVWKIELDSITDALTSGIDDLEQLLNGNQI